MGLPSESSTGSIVGRRAERLVLAGALRASAAGEPRVVLVHGEAGVGKSRLVRELCREAASAHHVVLWGNCIKLDAASVPLAPIAGALDRWLATLPEGDRASMMSGTSGLLGGWLDAGAQGGLLREVEIVLRRACAGDPTVLVVDDLQWADLTSLDALAYIVGGLRDERLLVVATCRAELGDFGVIRSWLADLRRSPSRVGDHGGPPDGVRDEGTDSAHLGR